MCLFLYIRNSPSTKKALQNFKYMFGGHSKYCFKAHFLLRISQHFLSLYSGTLIILVCASVTAFRQKATVMQMLLLPPQAPTFRNYLLDKTVTDKAKGRGKEEHFK